ncbi:tautomerase family protein [Paenibacillus sp. KS-LC4]|uniref:tautomerase family protein n=1 Tax=Paenibacillus sp. KS-LC4 TaxID=2979727 RepID=UPI0030CDEE5B
MPFVRVSYLESKYDEPQLSAISQVIMQALMEHFHVPEDDFFQVFHGHRSGEFFYSPDYLNIRRSDGLLYIQITLKSGRSTLQKQHFYKRVAERMERELAIREEDIFILLVGTELADWTFGSGIAQMLVPQGEMASDVRQTFGDIAPAFAKYSEEVLFGEVWNREQLSRRDRSLLTIAALVAGGATEQLPFHLRLGQQHGLTEEQVVEALTHLAFYAGWPRAAAAIEAAKQQFQENS